MFFEWTELFDRLRGVAEARGPFRNPFSVGLRAPDRSHLAQVTDVASMHYFHMTRLGAYLAIPLVYQSYYNGSLDAIEGQMTVRAPCAVPTPGPTL